MSFLFLFFYFLPFMKTRTVGNVFWRHAYSSWSCRPTRQKLREAETNTDTHRREEGGRKKISNLQKLHGVSVEGCRANQSLGRVTAEGGREGGACRREGGEGGGGGEGVMHCSRGMEEPDEEEEEEVESLSWQPCFFT